MNYKKTVKWLNKRGIVLEKSFTEELRSQAAAYKKTMVCVR